MNPKYNINQEIYYIKTDIVCLYRITGIYIGKEDIVYYFHNGYEYFEEDLNRKIKEKTYFIDEVEAQKTLISKLEKKIKDFAKEQKKHIAKAKKRIAINQKKK